jgi:hypothetical protein
MWQQLAYFRLHGAAASRMQAAAPGAAWTDYNAIIEIIFQDAS